MAKIVRFHRPGSPEVLQIEDIRVADPQEGEVRIRAVGLNRAARMDSSDFCSCRLFTKT